MENPPNEIPRAFSLIPWIVFGIVLISGVALLLPPLFTSSRVSTEHHSWTALKTLSTAEADFRANDRDWNHVTDFWTGDVKGLYTMTSAAVPGAGNTTVDPPIKLIHLALASSDVDPATIEAGGENLPIDKFAVPAAYRGYWHAALISDFSSPTDTTYKLDTGGKPGMGSCHHPTKFGFLAIPDSTSSGPYAYILNQDGVLYRGSEIRPSGRARLNRSVPPGLDGISADFTSWPDAQTLKMWWGKLD